MTEFTPVSAALGGILIGVAASMMLLLNGRIAGISGIFAGLLRPRPGDVSWRAAFIGGLLLAGALLVVAAPGSIAPTATRSVAATAAAGVLVGFGVRMGSGCTSGHGVCGLSRLSARSLVATLTFMATGMLTASLLQLVAGGAV